MEPQAHLQELKGVRVEPLHQAKQVARQARTTERAAGHQRSLVHGFMHAQLDLIAQGFAVSVMNDDEQPEDSANLDFSSPAERVIRALWQIIAWLGKLQVISCDNGPEYNSATIKSWPTYGASGSINPARKAAAKRLFGSDS
jgi:putative transposase